MRGFCKVLSALAFSAFVAGFLPEGVQDAEAKDKVLVFAASSLKDVMEDAGKRFDASHNTQTEFSFGGTQVITRQVVVGAPANVLVTADKAWMEFAEKNDAVQADSVSQLASNGLVLVSRVDGGPEHVALTADGLQTALDGGRLAMGESETVPAGRYGKDALEHLGLWAGVKAHLAPMENVRIALAAAARGEVPLALVYSSDAHADKNVKVVATFPQESYPSIVIPGALTQQATPASKAFLAFLKSAEGKAIFKDHGFVVSND